MENVWKKKWVETTMYNLRYHYLVECAQYWREVLRLFLYFYWQSHFMSSLVEVLPVYKRGEGQDNSICDFLLVSQTNLTWVIYFGPWEAFKDPLRLFFWYYQTILTFSL